MSIDADRVLGALLGGAFGDAMGYPTEFLTVEEIDARWPPSGPTDLTGKPARVSDDTQMTIAVGEAVVRALESNALDPLRLEPLLREAFVEWLRDPENDRAPGRTCIVASTRLESGAKWQDATVLSSKGCGANMRVAPVAFLREGMRGPVAQFQAALTHGHPTALAASDLTADAVARLAAGTRPDELLPALCRYAQSERTTYHGSWLGMLWSKAGAMNPEEYIARGWAECLRALSNVEEASTLDVDEDPCETTGDGWIAEEALATALACFLLHHDDPRQVVCRAARTRGDSDSIASIAGALAGAHHGIRGWPEPWADRIEYAAELRGIARGLAGTGSPLG